MREKILEIVSAFLTGAGSGFVVYLILYSTFLFLAVIVGAWTLYYKNKKRRFRNISDEKYFIPVSIIVPAYNEEVTVVDTVRSLLALDYISYEIIVVDDGSKDSTTKTLVEAFGMKKIRRPIRKQVPCKDVETIYECFDQKVPLVLIRKKNGGKADALNMGINACRYPYFICMDADSVLQADSLIKITEPVLADENVVAVGGVVRPCNDVELENGWVKKYRLPKNPIACMQVIEYDRSFLSTRILFDKFNGSLIISGAFGLFKKEAVIAVGGYDSKTMGEDMELVVDLHKYCTVNKKPYAIKYATDAVCWTQAPERLRDLMKQRKRWHLGLFQTLMKHRSMAFDFKSGPVSFISYAYFFIYEFLSPFIEAFGIIVTAIALISGLINWRFALLFTLLYALFGAMLSLTSFFARTQTAELTLSFKDVLKAMLMCLFEITFMHFVLTYVRATAFIGYRKKKLQWGRIERKKINLK
ncbi:MAG: glycosyltransferase [Clostridia bacterium]|nr:glycosyltransferase [Clostridia bacterium]